MMPFSEVNLGLLEKEVLKKTVNKIYHDFYIANKIGEDLIKDALATE